MARVVTMPPAGGLRPDGTLAGGWWHDEPDGGRIVCDLCPRECHLKPGDRGFCFVRENVEGEMVLTTFGRSTGFCIDPIEKKPLNHFYPGTSVLSFGTAGCNLGCKFCQNWDISKSREVERLSEVATPEAIAEAARQHGCRSVAFTYNDPVIWAEYAIETARACHAVGVKTVAVTAGYITTQARGAFYEHMDAANVDLKGFTEDFYRHITYSHLQPVLDTLEWLEKETDVWFEITNLVIPQANDGMDDIRKMCGWILEHCGDQVPLHFTAFHPDFRMRDRPNTPRSTLLEAYDVARSEGLKFVYVGNVDDTVHQSTYCPHCNRRVIERNWYELGEYRLRGDRCGHCGGEVAGHFDEQPGSWGRRRLPVAISRFAREPEPPVVIPPGALMNPTSVPATANAETTRKPPVRPPVSPEQQGPVLAAAAEFVAATIAGRPASLADATLAGAADIPVIGAYVTLKRRGHLRACCGFLGQPRPLVEALRHSAVVTASEDHRLPPISPTELPYLDLHVNLLHGLERLSARGADRVAAIEVGRHGLRIQRGESTGLLLPTVAAEHGWDAESYLRHICRKAGLPTTAWGEDDVDLWTFESVEFGGPFDPGAAASVSGLSARIVSAAELRTLAGHARETILALLQGMTPSYYLVGVPDGNVTGLGLTLDAGDGRTPTQVVQVVLRPGVPLQATLFRLCELAAQELRGVRVPWEQVRVGVSVLADPAMHGTVHDPDLRGFEPSRRALMVLEHGQHAWTFAPARSADEQLAVLREQLDPLAPEGSSVLSLEVQSTESAVLSSSVPPPVVRGGSRRPGVAGRFYPDDPAELARMVDGMLAASERRAEPWRAAMVPHAGLVYSGTLAASVLNRLTIPEVVIVIGPKHTRHGVGWAVSPCEAWTIPGATLASDPALAHELAAAIPGLRLDAAAHAQEHAIEVELPFLARLAPSSRVVGIALGGGSWERCQQFAEGLARVIRGMPSPPLLLISSDMNHFASEREGRRLDEIALAALERRDPAHLLATVNEHNISMCGVIPAAIVMETLRQLGGLSTCERVGYATSAEVSGNFDRVVGYAGVLLS